MRMEAVPRGRFTLMAYLSTKWKVSEVKKLPTPIYPYARGLPRSTMQLFKRDRFYRYCIARKEFEDWSARSHLPCSTERCDRLAALHRRLERPRTSGTLLRHALGLEREDANSHSGAFSETAPLIVHEAPPECSDRWPTQRI